MGYHAQRNDKRTLRISRKTTERLDATGVKRAYVQTCMELCVRRVKCALDLTDSGEDLVVGFFQNKNIS
jgi:hypothetical protein